VLTTLPVICFAGLGAATPRLAARFGAHRLVVAGLILAAIGTLLRAMVSSPWAFLVFSLFALAGGAVANVLLPSLVKAHFPTRIGQMTAVYTTALAVGTTAGAGLTVPIGDIGDGWRFGIGSWAVFDVLAILPWLVTLRGERTGRSLEPRLRAGAFLRSRTAWFLTAFFGMQSMQAYITFGWFERFLHAHDISSSTAGWMVALLSALGIPTSIVAPNVPVRYHRLLINVLGLCFVVAYIGLGVAPTGGAWVWMVLSGIGNGMFPLALTMIGLRSRTPETTGALSAFVQVIGYIVAGTGPLLFGVLYGATGSWVLPLALLWIALGLAWIFGWLACAPRFVDDELAEAASPAPA
jgi:CP family cyanate transporter-like MFS transporter